MKILSFLILLTMFVSYALAEGPALKSEQQYRNDSHSICQEEWTTRGELDRRMYNHCMEQQTNAYRELIQLHNYADQSFYAETSFPYCREEWSNRGIANVRMMVHCLEQEIEGIKDVMYYREQYGESEVNVIASRALARFGSWRMAAYQVERNFE